MLRTVSLNSVCPNGVLQPRIAEVGYDVLEAVHYREDWDDSADYIERQVNVAMDALLKRQMADDKPDLFAPDGGMDFGLANLGFLCNQGHMRLDSHIVPYVTIGNSTPVLFPSTTYGLDDLLEDGGDPNRVFFRSIIDDEATLPRAFVVAWRAEFYSEDYDQRYLPHVVTAASVFVHDGDAAEIPFEAFRTHNPGVYGVSQRLPARELHSAAILAMQINEEFISPNGKA